MSEPNAFAELERRLARVERILREHGLADAVAAVAAVEPPPVEPPPPPVVPPLPIAAATVRYDERGYRLDDDESLPGLPAPPVAAAADPIPLTEDDRIDTRAQFAAMRATLAGTSPPPRPVMVEPAAPPPSGGLEQLVGLKLAGWVGAIVFVIGAALGMKFAYDQGWLGGVPDSVRLGLLYAIGFAVVAAGEWVYRRVSHLASVGVFGAGVAILFVVGYAGDAYFDLYGQRVAFALMAGASAVGAIVAWRASLVSIAVLSLVGANLAPALLGDSAAGETTLLVYLLALQALALVLAHVGRGERWWVLRGVALATTALWIVVRLADAGTARSTPTIAFTILYAALFQLEAALAAWRSVAQAFLPVSGRSPESSGGVPPDTDRNVGATGRADARLQGTFAAFSASVTTFLTMAVLFWTNDWPAMQAGVVLLGMAMVAIVAGAAAAARPRGRAWREMAVSWLGQGMTLVVVAVPVALDGPAVAIAFGALALLYAAIGVYVRRPGPCVAAAIVWTLAVLHVTATFDVAPIVSMGGVPISRGLLLGLGLAGVGHALAALLASAREATLDRPAEAGPPTKMDDVAPPARATVVLAAAIGAAMPWTATFVAVVVCFGALPRLSGTVAVGLLAWATLIVARLLRRRDVGAIAMLVAGIALAKWLLVDALAARFGGAVSERPILNATMAVGAIVALSGVALVFCRTGILACLNVAGEADASGEGTASAAALRQAGMPVLQDGDEDDSRRARQVERLLAVGLSLGAFAIGLAVDLDAAARLHVANAASPRWNPTQLAFLLQTALATAIALAAGPVARVVAPRVTGVASAVGWLVVVIAAKFAVVDTLAFAFDERVWLPTPLMNVQAIVAAAVTAACVFAARRAEGAGPIALAMAAIVPLVAGSVEVARSVGPGQALVALSIFWAAYGATAIAVGFALRGGLPLRVGGLGLLAITIGKVVLVDLASAGTGWRILSFLGVGVLLLATSVLYGRFGATLLRRDDADERGFEIGETR